MKGEIFKDEIYLEANAKNLVTDEMKVKLKTIAEEIGRESGRLLLSLGEDVYNSMLRDFNCDLDSYYGQQGKYMVYGFIRSYDFAPDYDYAYRCYDFSVSWRTPAAYLKRGQIQIKVALDGPLTLEKDNTVLELQNAIDKIVTDTANNHGAVLISGGFWEDLKFANTRFEDLKDSGIGYYRNGIFNYKWPDYVKTYTFDLRENSEIKSLK